MVFSLEKIWEPETSRVSKKSGKKSHLAQILIIILLTHTRSLKRQEGKGSIVCCNPATREKGLLALSYDELDSCQACP